MEKLIIKEYKDFEKIVNKLKEYKKVEIDLNNLDYKIKTRVLDLITGYIYETGKIEKENIGKYIISLAK